MPEIRLPYTPAQGATTPRGHDDAPRPACDGDWQPFYYLIDHPGDIFARKECLDICKGCPIREACWDKHDGEEWVQALEAASAPQPTKKPSRVKCGTYSGWQRHMKNGEKPCKPCRDSRNAYQRERHHRLKKGAA